MDLLTFSSGVFSTLLGVFVMVFATKTVERKKQELESEKSLKLLYIELNDIQTDCKNNLLDMRETFLKSQRLQKGICKWADINELDFPRPLILVVLESTLDKCFHLLTYPQRNALRTILYLSNELKIEINNFMLNIDFNKLTPQDILKMKTCLSTLCVLYHQALNLSEQKERYIEIDKNPDKIMEDVLSSLHISIT